MMLSMRAILCTLLGIIVGVGVVHAETYEDWTVDIKDPEVFSVTTVNDSGRVFGQFCYLDDDSCLWLIALGNSCEKNHKYPVLANGDGGAVYVEMLCIGLLANGGYGYAFTNFDQIDNLVLNSKRLGFAIPMADDEFQLVQFNLRGAARALSAISEAATKRSKSILRSTRGKTL